MMDFMWASAGDDEEPGVWSGGEMGDDCCDVGLCRGFGRQGGIQLDIRVLSPQRHLVLPPYPPPPATLSTSSAPPTSPPSVARSPSSASPFSPCPNPMLSFAHLARPLPRDLPATFRPPGARRAHARVVNVARRSRFDEQLLTYDMDEEDEDEDEDENDFMFDDFPYEDVDRNRNNSQSKLSKTKNAGNVRLNSFNDQTSNINGSKSTEGGRVSKFSQHMKPATTVKVPRLAPKGHAFPLSTDINDLPSSFKTWEDKAYEIIRRQKLRNIAAQKEKKPVRTSEQQVPIATPTPSVKKNSTRKIGDSVFARLAYQHDLEEKCRSLIEHLQTLGLEEAQLEKVANRHKTCFQANSGKVRERLEFLTGLGVKKEDLSKMIVRHPQILEYTVEGMMKPRIQYLRSLGVPEEKLGRVLTVSPSLLECSLEKSLKPRVKYLLKEIKISEEDLPKIVVLSPQVLTQSIEDSLRPRVDFFIKKLGAREEVVAKMITKHPQLLHYSIEDGIKPRISFLRSIGLTNSDILKVLSRATQILSLSIEKSLQPKFDYLIEELKCRVESVISFPAYFSLSLDQRIRPRHRFLITSKRLPNGPFPMHILAVTDSDFCKRWANSTVEEYHAFRDKLVLKRFVKKFERKNRLQVSK